MRDENGLTPTGVRFNSGPPNPLVLALPPPLIAPPNPTVFNLSTKALIFSALSSAFPAWAVHFSFSFSVALLERLRWRKDSAAFTYSWKAGSYSLTSSALAAFV